MPESYLYIGIATASVWVSCTRRPGTCTVSSRLGKSWGGGGGQEIRAWKDHRTNEGWRGTNEKEIMENLRHSRTKTHKDGRRKH
jgi:hypothetical protein